MQRRISMMPLAMILVSLLGPVQSGCTAMARAPGQTGEPARQVFDYFGGLVFDQSIPTPASVLGYEIGERFTRHGDLVGYFERLAAVSDRVVMSQYGRSHQGRGLWTLTISSPANLARLDEILAQNRALAEPRSGDAAEAAGTIERNPAIVWFSYNVHGNEPSSSETAIQVAYTMAAGTNEEIQEILDKVVLVIDPMLNPDGRERYVSWYQNTRGVDPNSNPDASEHNEPWPGGRTNHYLFDLNRDWLWLVHPESRSRIAAYREYMPQLHIDFHEQRHLNPYFFGAGDEPYNMNIPAQTREWVEMYGRENAVVFDGEGLVYTTRERFDYLYPGYGKVLPVYHGAVGMLAEKAGHSRAGLAIKNSEHHTLTLGERAYHHFLLSMSNLETTAANREGQLERFAAFFQSAVDDDERAPKAFVILPENDGSLLEKVWELCSAHGIEIHRLDEAMKIDGLRGYRDGAEEDEVELAQGTWIVRTDQPMGRLARAIFERETEVSSIETYDITGWSIPVSFGLDAYYREQAIDASMSLVEGWARPRALATGDGTVALIVDSMQHDFPEAVGAAVENGLFARYAGKAFTLDGQRFGAGSLVVHQIRNEQEDLDSFVDAVLKSGLSLHRAGSGFTEDGPALGAVANPHAVLPKILLVRGSGTDSNSFGQHWHMLDIESPIPHTTVNASDLGRVDLDEYNVLLLPNAYGLGSAFGETTTGKIKSWVRGGGAVVATGGAATWANKALLNLDAPSEDEDDKKGDDEEDAEPKPSEMTFEERKDRRIERSIPGSLVRVVTDTTHPLCAGVPEWLGIIKRGTRRIDVQDNGYVVATFDEQSRIGGVISDKNQERLAGSAFMTQHRLGSGAVICLTDDVTIRGFHHAGMRLLLNAVIYGPTLGRF